MPANKKDVIAKLVSLDRNKPERDYDKPISVRLPEDVLEALQAWETTLEKKTGKKRTRSKIIVELLRDALRIKGQKQD